MGRSFLHVVRELSADRQDMVGELLLTQATADPQYALTREQIDDLKLDVQ
jgi:hypothetical protein